MSFISYNTKEDMQNETFASLAWDCNEAKAALKAKEPVKLLCELDAIFRTCINRWGDKKEAIRKEILAVEEILFREEEMNDYQRSVVFKRLREVYTVMMGVLDDKGLLFRIRQNLDELYKQSGGV